MLCSTAPACRTHTKHKHRQSRPLLPFQLLETVKVHTCDALWYHKHTHIHGSSEYRHFLRFSVTCLGHTVTPHLCISHVKVQNHIMANSSILRLQHERAYVGDCLKAGLRQDSTAIDSLPLGDLGTDRGSWQALERQRCSSVSQLVSYQQMQLRDCELVAKKHVLNNSWYLTCLLRKISRSWLLTFWGFSCFLSFCSSSTPPL